MYLFLDGVSLRVRRPTDRTFEVQHIHMYRVLDGKIVEHFANRDDVGMMRHLGQAGEFEAPRGLTDLRNLRRHGFPKAQADRINVIATAASIALTVDASNSDT